MDLEKDDLRTLFASRQLVQLKVSSVKNQIDSEINNTATEIFIFFMCFISFI